jgi:Zn-finger nucleic acid-binding protein
LAAAPALACGNCGRPLAALSLSGHYGRLVEIDLCGPCHLVWFDTTEGAQLAGTGLLNLVGEMAALQTLPHHTASADLPCPRCQGRLKTVHNRTRWGHSLQLECLAGHGAWQTFGQFLAEKGLLRAMTSADRARALARDGALNCVNCGGDIGQADSHCRWCASAPALVDVARLAAALDPDTATAGHRVHGTAPQALALNCAACGAAQLAAPGWQCVQCGATLTATGLAEAHRAVSALGPALADHARKPAPHVVQQRLAAQQPALDRQRQRAAQMQAEADEALGRHGWQGEPDRHPLGQLPPGVQRGLLAVLVVIALLLWLTR